MVTESTNGMGGSSTQDEIDRDQQQLDTQQGIQPTQGEYVTVEQFQQMMDQVRQLDLSNRTVQGMIQRGLNTVQQNTIEYVNNELAKSNRGAALDRLLQEFPEDEHDRLRKFANYLQPDSGAQSQVAPAQDNGNNADALAEWEPWFEAAQEWGLDPADTRINWTIVTEGNASPAQRVVRMNKHFAELVGGQPVQAARVPASRGSTARQPRAAKTATPSSDGPPGKSTQSIGTPESLYDAFILGQITAADAKALADKNNWTF